MVMWGKHSAEICKNTEGKRSGLLTGIQTKVTWKVPGLSLIFFLFMGKRNQSCNVTEGGQEVMHLDCLSARSLSGVGNIIPNIDFFLNKCSLA